jgi:hypothetical protein
MALFSLSTLGFIVGSELLVRFQVVPGNSYDIQKRAFHGSDNKAVAFGDSRAASGILKESGFTNFAAAGESLETTLGKLEAYVASGRARYVLLQLGPQHFSFYRLSLNQAALLEDFLDIEPRFLQMLRPQFRRYLFDYWAAILRNPSRLFSNTDKNASNEPNAIPRLRERPADARQRQAMIRTQLHIPVPGYASTADMKRLRDTLTRVRDSGVTLCLVSFPVSSTYRDAAGYYPIFDQIRADYAALSTDLGITYVDLWDAYGDDNFANVDHLNQDGAIRLSGDLRRICKNGNS